MKNFSILIVEDDKILSNTLENVLATSYEITTTNNALEAKNLLKEKVFQLILLDIVLSKDNRQEGLELCAHIRMENKQTPILMITGKKAINYKLGAFNLGADDYLCKPFNLLELNARIRALINRYQIDTGSILTYKDVVLDIDKRTISRRNQLVTLRKSEFEIVKLLIQNSCKVISREHIMKRALNKYDVTNNCIDVHIRHIRQKLEDPFKSKIIETVYGVGYKLSP